MNDSVVKFAIEEWNIKDKRWCIIEEYEAKNNRKIKMRYNVLCARYPNNTFRLVELKENVLYSRIVNREAEGLADEL